jgi:hypothetical protein
MGATLIWNFFPGLLSGNPKTKTFVVLKLWTFIFSSNQIYFEHVRATSYNPKENLFNGVSHTLIKNDLTPTLRGFVVEN